jgi:hypothetical protein
MTVKLNENFDLCKNVSELSDSTEHSESTVRPHCTAETSKEVFISLTNEGRLVREKNLVYSAIRDNQPVTSRMLCELIDRERGNVCRSLYDLLHEIRPAIQEAFVKPCPRTGRRVKWYSLIDWKSDQHGEAV